MLKNTRNTKKFVLKNSKKIVLKNTKKIVFKNFSVKKVLKNRVRKY